MKSAGEAVVHEAPAFVPASHVVVSQRGVVQHEQGLRRRASCVSDTTDTSPRVASEIRVCSMRDGRSNLANRLSCGES